MSAGLPLSRLPEDAVTPVPGPRPGQETVVSAVIPPRPAVAPSPPPVASGATPPVEDLHDSNSDGFWPACGNCRHVIGTCDCAALGFAEDCPTGGWWHETNESHWCDPSGRARGDLVATPQDQTGTRAASGPGVVPSLVAAPSAAPEPDSDTQPDPYIDRMAAKHVSEYEPALESVSGRSEPRPVPDPEGFAHLMTVVGQADGSVKVICTCHENGRLWKRTIDAYHLVDDLTELKRQHCGDGVARGVVLSLTCASVVGELACILPAGHPGPHHAEFRGHSIAWPDDEPVFGTESTVGGAS